MHVLLDTHVLLWTVNDLRTLDTGTRSFLADSRNEVFFSAVSIWEIAIKARLWRADFKARPEIVLKAARTIGLTELPVDADVAVRVADLPLHHADPFDRLLVAQAMAGPMRLLTADRVLSQYSELVTVIAAQPR